MVYADYDRYLAAITATTTPRELATLIVDRYNADTSGDEPYTIAALDTSKLQNLAARTNALAVALAQSLPSGEPKLRAAFVEAQKFDYDVSYTVDALDGYVDLADLARKLVAQAISPDVSQAAQAVAEAIGGHGEVDRVVVSQKVVSGQYRGRATWDFASAYGLSIYHAALPAAFAALKHSGLAHAVRAISASCARSIALLAVMIATGNDNDLGDIRAVDQSMFVVDPARPIACEIGLERFRLANAFERGA